MKIACPRGQVKNDHGQVKIEDCLYPSTLGYVTSQSFVSILHCMYTMHNTRPHPCTQPRKQGEWGE